MPTTLPAPLPGLEARLRAAMLAGDADTLADLIADDVLFADMQGQLLPKAADLAAHRSGTLRLTTLQVVSEEGRLLGDAAALVTVLAEVAGTYGGQPFAGRARYVRVWARQGGRWQVAGGSVSQVPGSAAA